jgi:hypothetical protein
MLSIHSHLKAVFIFMITGAFIAQSFCVSADTKELPLVKSGKAIGQVVFGRDSQDKAAAKEFSRYIEKITGAALPVVSEENRDKKPSLLVGNTTASEGLKHLLEGEFCDDGRYILSPADNGLVVYGKENALWHGVYGLLRKAGCRFYMPSERCEYIPRMEDISLSLEHRVVKPDYSGKSFAGAPGGQAFAGPFKWNIKRWYRKMGIPGIWFDHFHSFNRYIPAKEFYEEHPEYFALSDGKRLPNQLCLTNPEVLKMITGKIRERFEDGLLSASISSNDAQEYCDCPECLAEREGGKWDFTVNLIHAANRIARALHEKYPDRYICFYATYQGSGDLPEDIIIEPNVVPVFFPRVKGHAIQNPACPDGRRFIEILKTWKQHGMKYFGIYDYLMQVSHSVAIPVFHAMADSMRYCAEQEGLFWHYERLNRSWMNNLQLYMAARLGWDASLDIDVLLADFYHHFYGPAAEPMARYYARLEQNNSSLDQDLHGLKAVLHLWTPEIRADCEKDLDEAARAVAGHETLARRVEIARKEHTLNMQAFKVGQAAASVEENPQPENRKAYRDAREQYSRLFEQTREFNLILPESYRYLTNDPGPSDEYEILMQLPQYWQFALDKENQGKERGWYKPHFDDSGWESLSTRLFWEVQGYTEYDGYACYRTSFSVPESIQSSEDLFLYFGAVDDHAWVYVNGEYAGKHAIGSIGWNKPFAIPVDGFIQPGEKCQIAVRVWDMNGKGGIFRRVWLVRKKS